MTYEQLKQIVGKHVFVVTSDQSIVRGTLHALVYCVAVVKLPNGIQFHCHPKYVFLDYPDTSSS